MKTVPRSLIERRPIERFGSSAKARRFEDEGRPLFRVYRQAAVLVGLFAELCPSLQIGQQPADQLPWFHIVTLLTKVTDAAEREWYAVRAAERVRATLQANIKAQLHLRGGNL
jgi:hypothetical protein